MFLTQSAQNGLDRGLAELEALGLPRPANVLLAEYLDALAAEELILDASVAAQISAAYNRARYSVVAANDGQVTEAAAALNRVANRLTAMSPEERAQVSERVRERMRLLGGIRESPGGALPELGVIGNSQVAAPTGTTPVPATRPIQDETALGESPDNLFDLSDQRHVVLATSADAKRGRKARTLEWLALAGLAIFFGGYFERNAADKVAQSMSGEQSEGFASQESWIDAARAVGLGELRANHFGKTRVALEFVLAYSKEDPFTLNQLAWSYVNPDEQGTTNPQRAWELIDRAIKVQRRPEFLDTAAEAQFQLGHSSEAVSLEQEALVRAGGQPAQLVDFLEKQLTKFQNGEQKQAQAKNSK
jgi:hypothetical protein